ncbi:unnamed protein product [Acanthoscelides obtectus]|uniref:Zinc finger protein n=1 Tax=Acanthoscelides obtectus TaxID=200917 RepID=A0A9P0LTJ7_ACAOB|nr:unnamed protein product [Acanthoscelides obtectus]CAH2002903.1 unnamed protein product [Acanthoscelides obtectus]CAK1629908.1 Zinc finger protein 395 [Acanthoscelides obtectus]CAK1629924.1 Zinc finger protein 395 [Acanthoscelides obtectus]
MARPFHEDPDYQRLLVGNMRQSLLAQAAANAGIGGTMTPQSPHKLLKLSPSPGISMVHPLSPAKAPVSPRRARGENKKCRKVYGMEHREQWCTQCKWKKACSRFGD